MRIVMLWWFVAAVGSWLATGAFIPVLWKLSKLVSDEEPTGTEVTGAVLSVPVVQAASIVDTAATG
jgi:hypothetical protein